MVEVYTVLYVFSLKLFTIITMYNFNTGVSQSIDINFRLATDYPVDLYYLMDLSSSMKDDKDNVAQVGFRLAELLNNLTTQYRLGFGSFVDKVLMPYVDTSPTK